jgi:hypothetical protein
MGPLEAGEIAHLLIVLEWYLRHRDCIGEDRERMEIIKRKLLVMAASAPDAGEDPYLNDRLPLS